MAASGCGFTIRCDVISRLTAAFANEVRRALCMRGLAESTFSTSQFGRCYFRCGNRVEYHRTVQFGGEPNALAAFLFLLRADDVVWDVGASVGLFTMHAAGEGARVIAFEPDPATFARLRHNVGLNGTASRIECRHEALGDREGHVTLRSDGLAGFAPSLADLGRHGAVVRTPMTTIDALVASGVPAPSVLKIDVEGAELLVLQGAGQLLHSATAPRVIFMEVHPRFLPAFNGAPEDVERVLAGAGYRIAARRPRDEQVHLIALRD
jgi:FkbM family methyltransferase